MYKHTRKEGLDYMEDRDKMNGNGMEKGTIGQDSQLRFVLPCLDPGRYSIEEWNRAAAYIMGTECAYPDSAKAREALVAFSREKAENGIYRSREEWYGNR